MVTCLNTYWQNQMRRPGLLIPKPVPLLPPQHHPTRGSQGPWTPQALTQALESLTVVLQGVHVGEREEEEEERG